MAKRNYYDISNLLSTGAQYMIMLGQRANGKSYQAKLTALTAAYKDDSKFVYLRRWVADIKTASVEAYFKDINISKITDGEYDGIKAWRNTIYFTQTEEDGKTVRAKEIGTYCALNEAERYKSWAFKGYKYIVFEEFITDLTYLVNEPMKLQQFVSTVARLDRVTVLMVGNTLSRVCPYFKEWCLEGVLKQKIGTIDMYHFNYDGGIVNIAVEYCGVTKNENKMFFGTSAKQIISGEWDVTDSPRLPRPYEEYEMAYELLVTFQSFKFVMQLLIEPIEGGRVVYIYPFTGHREFIRQISDTFTDDPWVTNKLNNALRPEAMMIECFRMGKVCYSDNLTGSDFTRVNKEMRIA